MDPKDLVASAVEARNLAYAPYSGYKVGAAVLTESGRIFTGANVENASYGLTICAERVAATKAVSSGESKVSAIAVVAEGGASMCGACRQVIYEFGPAAKVYLAQPGGAYRETTMEVLLPGAFRKDQLKRS